MTSEQKSEGGGRVSPDNIWGPEGVRAKTEAPRRDMPAVLKEGSECQGEEGASWGSGLHYSPRGQEDSLQKLTHYYIN